MWVLNINSNGKFIKLEGDEWDEMIELVCVCGHKLKEHSFTHGFGTTRTWITSQCVRCGFAKKDEEHPQGFVCEQFRIKEGKNDARWSGFV